MPFSGLWGLPLTLRQASSGAVVYTPGQTGLVESRASSAYYYQSLNGLGVVYTPGGTLTESRASTAYYYTPVTGPV